MPSSFWNVSSVISPEGTIIQTCRGASSCFASARERLRRRLDLRVVGLDLVPVPLEPLRHPGPHPAEADHAQLHLDLLQSDSHDTPAPLLERREVAGRLRADQAPEAEVATRDRQLLSGVVDDLDEETGVRPTLVQLPRGVQVARAEAARDDAARLVRPGGEGSQLAFAGGVDERLDADVVALARLGQQLVERAARRDVGLAGGENLVRLVLRRLNVGLVERVDPEDVAGDRGRELPPEPLLSELVRDPGGAPRRAAGPARPAARPAPV